MLPQGKLAEGTRSLISVICYLPPELRDRGRLALHELLDAQSEEQIQSALDLAEVVDKAKRHQQARVAFQGLLIQLAHAYGRSDDAEMLRHFKTFSRLIGEFNAPLATRAELQEELDQALEAAANERSGAIA